MCLLCLQIVTVVCCGILILGNECQRMVPVPKFEALWNSKTLRVSIPDNGTLRNFVFRGKLNEELHENEYGREWSANIIYPTDGRFLIDDYKTKLKIGDEIYYRISVDYRNTSYRTLLDPRDTQRTGKWIVDGYVYYNGTSVPVNLIDASNCRYQSKTMLNGKPICGAHHLIFNEDFEEDTISRELWFREHRFAGPPDYEFVAYLDDDENSFIENGTLIIKPILLENKYGAGAIEEHLDLGENCTGRLGTKDCKSWSVYGQIQKPVISARLRSVMSFRYGRVVIRAKLPVGDWLTPELILEPADIIHDEATTCSTFPGRMRIAFPKYSQKAVTAGLIRCPVEPMRSQDLLDIKLETPGEFHEYSLEWTPDNITISVDGVYSGEVIPRRIPHESEQLAFGLNYNREVNIILGLGVGGINDFPDDIPGKPWINRDPKNMLKFWQNREQWLSTWESQKGQLEIDYVRVYAL